MAKMCPKCGALDSQKEFVGVFCVDCYSKSEKVFDNLHNPTIRVCRSCNRAVIGQSWVPFDEQGLGEWIAAKLRTKLPISQIEVWQEDAKNGYDVHCKIEFDTGSAGAKIVRETNFLLRTHVETCDDCHKRSGGYHECIVQVRGENKEKVRKVAEKIARIAAQESFVSGWEEKKEGVDIQVGKKAAAKMGVAAVEKPFSTSHKLIGMREGKRIYRLTICVRV